MISYMNIIFNNVIVYNYVCAMLALRRPYLLIDEAMVNNNTTFNVKQTSIGSILLILFFVS